MDCKICKEFPARDIKLVGGYSTRLCNDHGNEWHEFISDKAEFKEFSIAEARYGAAMMNSSEIPPNFEELIGDTLKTNKALFNIAKEWVNKKTKSKDDKDVPF